MLRLLLGRGDKDGSAHIFQCITRPRQGDDRRCLIVPEQASHEAERALCAAGGDGVSAYAEVLSFTRLASRVFAAEGGGAAATLDAGGRILLLLSAIQAVSSHLTVYANSSNKPAFLTQMLATIDELKSCRISPAELETAGESEGKLKDLALIYGAYDALTCRVAADPRDRLTRLAQRLTDSSWAEGREFYLTGFTDFTPQERQVIAALLEQGGDVTVHLLCDGVEEGDPIFDPGRKTARQLLRLAKTAGAESQISHLTHIKQRPPALAHLEAQLFAQSPLPYAGEPEEIALFRADTPRSEVEWAAARLRQLAMEGVRFRDMAVAARDFEPYRPLVETIFPRYGLPVFTSAMTDILEKPALAVISAALDILDGGWQREDVFRYLKTGLTDLTADEVDRLENYTETWDIRGSRWTADRDWLWHHDGRFGTSRLETDTVLQELNALRKRVTAPLLALEKTPGKTGRDRAAALFAFLDAIELPKRLEERSHALLEQEQPQKAEEYRQLWDILCQALDQCAAILEETPMELTEFGRVLKLVLSQYDVGTIPVSLDRITAGELPRLSGKRCAVLCLLGGDEGQIPKVGAAPGLLTDEDRLLLSEHGLEPAPRAADKLEREWTILYEGCIRPENRLLVFYPAHGAEGDVRHPSVLVHRLRQVFPDLTLHMEGEENFRLTAPAPALESGQEAVWPLLEALEDYAPRVERLRASRSLTRGHLSPAAVDALYGKKIPMSASRMDKYHACHFSYFMQYGLKARPRKRAGFAAPEYGTFVHAVLEYVLKAGGDRCAPEERNRLVEQAVERYIREELGGLEHQTPRFVYLFRRLRKTVGAVVENACGELAAGDFRPIAFELGFGEKGDLPPVTFEAQGVTVSLSGFVDRVDGWEQDGRLYLRVVDYKTGRKSFDWSDIWNGMGLQMLLYLSALTRQGGERFSGKELIPAGALYIPAHDVVVRGSPDLSDDALRKEMEKNLRRKGVVLDDAAVIAAMETPPEGEDYRYLPLKVSKKEGQITGDILVRAEGLGKLARHVDRALADLAAEMARGNITADPFWHNGDQNACLYCDYAAACQFREGVGGDCLRPMKSMKQAEFWERFHEREVKEHGLSSDG